MARLFSDESNQYLIRTEPLQNPPFSMACWFNGDEAGGQQCLMNLGDTETEQNNAYRLFVDTDSDFVGAATHKEGLSPQTSTSPTTWAIDTWQHAAGVWASTSSRIAYLDGSAGAENVVTRDINNVVDVMSIAVMRWATSTFQNYFSGMMAEAAIWDAALTDAEIAILALGYSPLLIRPQSLVAYWPLIGRTSPEIDVVGGYDMTLNNGPTTADHPPVLYPSRSIVVPPLSDTGVVTVNTLVLAGSAPTTSVTPGATSVTVNELILAGNAITASVDATTPQQVNVNTLALAGSAVSLSVSASIIISADTLILAGSAETLTVVADIVISASTLTLAGSAVLLYALVNVFSPVEAALLREQQHQLLIWGNVLVPDTIWTARINDVTATRSTTAIVFDTGAGTDYSLITASQEVWIGTSAGTKDIAKLRIRSIASGDGGVTGTLDVAHHPWILADDHYITFKFDYPIRQKFPLLATDGTFYKDRDIAYADDNTEPKPVCICGTDRAGWLDAGSGDIDFEVDVSESYAVAEGASITSYSLTVLPSTGSSTVFNTSTGVGTITFTTTGQRWVRFSAVDSNGKSQFTFRCYWVNDPDPGGADHPMFEFSGIRLNGDWERGGWNSFFQVQNDATLTDIPDEARILLWSETTYGTANRAITLLPENDVETIFNGYLIRDTVQQDLKTGAGTVNFEMHTPHEMLRRFNFTVSLEVVQGTPATWWQYEEWMTVGRAIHHLWKHHSTVFRCWDVLGLLDNAIPKAFTEFEDADLFSMADTFAFQRSIRAHIVCDVGGRFHLTQDLQLLTDGERGNKRDILDITMDDLSGQLELRREPINKVAFVKVSGFMWDGTTFITDERNEIVPEKLPICASAPGLAPAYGGESVHVLDRQNFISQVHANEIAGRVFAQENNEYRSIPMSFHGSYHGVFDVAYDHFYTMSLQAGDTERGVVWTDKKLICRSVAVQFDTTKGSAIVNSTFEAVMDGMIGEPAYCMDEIPDYGGEEPDIDDDEMPDALVTAGPGSSMYFKSGYGSAWSQRSTQGVQDLIQDPFWPNKQSSVASNDAILLDCGVGFIRRSVDGGQNWSTVTPSSNPPNDASDSPAPTVAGVTFSQIDSNWVYLDEFVALAIWQNGSGDWRSWIAYTANNGASWSWQSCGEGYARYGIESVGSSQLVHEDGNVYAYNMTGRPRFIAGLDADTAVFAFEHHSVQQASEDYGILSVRAVTINANDTYSVGTRVVVETNYAGAERDFYLLGLSSTKFIIVYNDATDTAVYSRIGTVTGNSISLGTKQTVSSNWSDVVSVAKFDSTNIAVAYAGSIGLAIRVGVVSGTTVSYYSEQEETTDTTNLGAQIDLAILPGSDILVCFWRVWGASGLANITSAEHTGSGSITWGDTESTPDVIYSHIEPTLQGLNSTQALAIYRRGSPVYGAYIFTTAVNPSTLAISYSTVRRPFPGSNDEARPAYVDSGTVLLQGREGPHTSLDYQFVFVDPSTNQISLGDVIDSGDGIDTYSGRGIEYLADGKYVSGYLQFTEDVDVNNIESYILHLPDANTFKGMGVSVGKGAGDRVYVTGWDGGHLKLEDYSLPSLTLYDAYDLGLATSSQVSGGTYYAYPFSGIGDDDWVIAFGRMSNPYSLGTPVYVIESDDGGVTAALVQTDSTWTTGGCTAIWVEPNGFMYAIRNLGTSAKLYYGNAVVYLSLMSTLTFPAGVNPHGLKLDPYTLAIYAAADTAQSVMIVKSHPFYTSWTDMTYDHGTSSSVNSLELL